MKALSLIASLLLACAPAFAAPPPADDAPPPPAIDDPGVEPSPDAVAPAADEAAQAQPVATEDPLAPLPKPDARLVRDKASRDAAATRDRIADSDVTRRQQGEDTVEEYRQDGRLWMIRIVRPDGPAQTFMDNDGSGRLVRDPTEGPVSPVYYTLYQWK